MHNRNQCAQPNITEKPRNLTPTQPIAADEDPPSLTAAGLSETAIPMSTTSIAPDKIKGFDLERESRRRNTRAKR
ncbi:hypothetical protein [Shewanella sp.]|uniref:hypothetical protein n=1 Tax=Shewanella sp. TaxID=50422 RepID=UPI003F669047